MASCLLENPKVIPLGEGGINLKVARESAPPQVIKDFCLKTSKAAKPAKPAKQHGHRQQWGWILIINHSSQLKPDKREKMREPGKGWNICAISWLCISSHFVRSFDILCQIVTIFMWALISNPKKRPRTLLTVLCFAFVCLQIEIPNANKLSWTILTWHADCYPT